MKKLVAALMLISLSMVSCGKKNTTNDNINGVAYSPVSTINSDSNFQNLQTSIMNLSFPTANINYYTEFHFGTVANTCVTKDGWFGIDYQRCSTTVSAEQILKTFEIDVNAKKNELSTILSKTVVFNASGSSTFILRTTDNYTYVIRTDYPIQANPVYSVNNADGKAKQLLYIR